MAISQRNIDNRGKMNKYDSMKRIYDENYEGNIQCKTKIISFPLQVNSGGILAPLFKIDDGRFMMKM